MRVHICAVGRLRKGPERDLYDDYLTRFDRTGRALALGPAQLIEVEDKKGGGMPAEAALLERAIPTGSLICVMDERGKVQSSPEFADMADRMLPLLLVVRMALIQTCGTVPMPPCRLARWFGRICSCV
jgi:23S rRNA pseudoU1915 N3-methylase RlmH